MALFNKKLSITEILKAIDGLSEEEIEQVKAKVNGTEEAVEEAKGEVVEETTEEIGEEEKVSTEEAEEINEEPSETEEVETTEEAEEQPETEELNEVEEDNQQEVMKVIMDKLTALEERLAEFDELKGLMEEFTKKQADSIGYKGAIPGAKKDINEMSANELREKMLKGEI